MPGELLVGGPPVCNGYINRPELTASKFIKSPDSTTWYHTGDRVRLDRDGRMLYVGRVGGDRQIKIRGQRTELGEIEQAI
ncbi:amino acid adenylation domain-containing protein [Microdochium nivale]|nr:amino acid adenylation domain-containing protein [Microdochium nivale]